MSRIHGDEGLGQQVVFQLGPATVNLAAAHGDFNARIQHARRRDSRAASQDRANGRAKRDATGTTRKCWSDARPRSLHFNDEDDDEDEEAWKPVQVAIDKLKKLIDGSPWRPLRLRTLRLPVPVR